MAWQMLAVWLALAPQGGASWPQWLGPTQNGAAAEGGVFAAGGAVRLEKAWSRPLETGQAGLAVGEGRVFTLFRDGADDYAVALRADTGAEAWRVRLDPGVESAWLSGPPSTPAVHDGRVFTLSSGCRLRGHEAASGRVLWEIDVKEKFGAVFQIGCATSPFVEGGRLYVQTGGREDHRLAAFDPKTGAVIWTAKGTHRAVNASPVAAELGGVRQVLVHHTAGEGRIGITGFRLADGAALWSADVTTGFSFDPPQTLPGDRVFLATANELQVVRITRQGEGWTATPAWRSTDLQAFVSPPVFHRGHLFGFAGDFLACVEAESGRTAWKEKIYPGSLILVDGHLVVLSTGAGLLRVVEASPAGYREKARIEVFNKGAQTLAPPAFAGRRIFVRNEEAVAAVDIR
jgi:outer membrane protein assembly factor BamB